MERVPSGHRFQAQKFEHRICGGGTKFSPGFGTWIASLPVMTDERYLALLLWTICVLVFACSVVAITQHPDWFGA